jgi:hypothetical protein
MMQFDELAPAQASALVPHAGRLRLAAAAYLARFTGTSRDHADSDLRCYLTWCAERGLDPLLARRPYLELYIRWMQEIRRFKPPAVSRRLSVTAGFCRTCVIDGVLDHSPAEYVRRPPCQPSHRPWDSRTCSSRPCSPPPPVPNRNGFALAAILGLLSLRIFEATSADISDLGEERGHLDHRVVISLQRAINNPDCEMQRPWDWISQDPDFSCLRSAVEFNGFLSAQERKDYPAAIQRPVHVGGKGHAAGCDVSSSSPEAVPAGSAVE